MHSPFLYSLLFSSSYEVCAKMYLLFPLPVLCLEILCHQTHTFRLPIKWIKRLGTHRQVVKHAIYHAMPLHFFDTTFAFPCKRQHLCHSFFFQWKFHFALPKQKVCPSGAVWLLLSDTRKVFHFCPDLQTALYHFTVCSLTSFISCSLIITTLAKSPSVIQQ